MTEAAGFTPTNDVDRPSPDDAFALLRSIVEQRVTNGRSTRSASIKPVMVDQGFDQISLGFSTFRDFLIEAERKGIVSLVSAPVGPDVDVLPAKPEAPGEVVGPRDYRIRFDIWQAFVEWTPGLRLYDRVRDSVVITTDREDDPTARQLRAAWSTEPNRFVPIRPIHRDSTMSWMSEFIEALPDGDLKEQLAAALDSPRPFKAFKEASERLSVEGRWREVRYARTRQAIEGWVSANGLRIDLRKRPDHDSLAEHSIRRPLPGRRAAGSARERVLRALHQMSTAELLRLSIPAEYLVDPDSIPDPRS